MQIKTCLFFFDEENANFIGKLFFMKSETICINMFAPTLFNTTLNEIVKNILTQILDTNFINQVANAKGWTQC